MLLVTRSEDRRHYYCYPTTDLGGTGCYPTSGAGAPPGFCNRGEVRYGWYPTSGAATRGSEEWVYKGSRVRSPPEADTVTAVHTHIT